MSPADEYPRALCWRARRFQRADWARLKAGRLLADVVQLLQHREWVLAALDDLRRCFEAHNRDRSPPDATARAAERKLAFYLAWAAAQPAEDLAVLAAAVTQAVAGSDAALGADRPPEPILPGQRASQLKPTAPPGPKITEL